MQDDDDECDILVLRSSPETTMPETSLFSQKPFVIPGVLFSQGKRYEAPLLVDTGATGYSFVNERMIKAICNAIGVSPIPLSKPKKVRGYNGQISKTLITYIILLGLELNSYKELTVPMLITDLGQHDVILSKP